VVPPNDANPAPDVTFAHNIPLQPLPRLVFALLRSPLLCAMGTEPDARTHLQCLCASLEPAALVRTLYPALSSYADPDEVAFPRHSLSRAALTTSGSPIFLLDAYSLIVVYYAPGAAAQFPPPHKSALRDTINKLREERPLTPRVVFLKGGVDDVSAFEAALMEEPDPERLRSEGASYVQFTQQMALETLRFLRPNNG